MLSKIRGFLTLIEFAISVAIVIVLMYLFKSKAVAIRKGWFWLQIKILGIKIKEYGKPNWDANLIVANHQSLLDIIIIEYLNSRDIAWVAKKEIADMFFYGHILKAPKMIIVDRENKSTLVKLIKDVKDRLNHNRPIAIFPEGTRSKGKRLLKFKPGTKIIAEKYNLLIQPVILINSRKILDSLTLKVTPGEVKVIYLEPVIAKKGTSWYEELEEKMNEVYNKYK